MPNRRTEQHGPGGELSDGPANKDLQGQRRPAVGQNAFFNEGFLIDEFDVGGTPGSFLGGFGSLGLGLGLSGPMPLLGCFMASGAPSDASTVLALRAFATQIGCYFHFGAARSHCELMFS